MSEPRRQATVAAGGTTAGTGNSGQPRSAAEKQGIIGVTTSEDKSLKKVQLITDGSCLGNPGKGGWACVMRYKDYVKEMYGSEPRTTNNRMELTAAVEGLAAIRERCEVEVVTDSNYVKNGISTWIHNWKRRGWMTAEKKPVVNQDLWEMLDEQNSRHRTNWVWTKGHANHSDNNRCDELAQQAAREQISQLAPDWVKKAAGD